MDRMYGVLVSYNKNRELLPYNINRYQSSIDFGTVQR